MRDSAPKAAVTGAYATTIRRAKHPPRINNICGGVVRLAAPLVAALAIAGCSATGSSNVPATVGQLVAQTRSHRIPLWKAEGIATAVCPNVVGKPACFALTVNTGRLIRPSGWTPSDLEAAYDLPSASGEIVAIVDAYDNPNIASDLATYRAQFGLPKAKFAKYNQDGLRKNYPQGSVTWAVEEDLDVEMVSAACPHCTIYLVEANTSDGSDLQKAETRAVMLGAHIVSNSWGCTGSNDCVAASDFRAPGVIYLAASGDYGYGVIGPPAAFDSVVAVGGTQLSANARAYYETVWPDAGSGCAAAFRKPKWQHDPDCTARTETDVSAEAGCLPGVAEYDSYGAGGWIQECGTSVSTPFNAGVFALAGKMGRKSAPKNFWTLNMGERLHDLHVITSGSNGSCGGKYLCQAGSRQFKTYAGPTGWGTPRGVATY
jgi:subtilase family serine protease